MDAFKMDITFLTTPPVVMPSPSCSPSPHSSSPAPTRALSISQLTDAPSPPPLSLCSSTSGPSRRRRRQPLSHQPPLHSELPSHPVASGEVALSDARDDGDQLSTKRRRMSPPGGIAALTEWPPPLMLQTTLSDDDDLVQTPASSAADSTSPPAHMTSGHLTPTSVLPYPTTAGQSVGLMTSRDEKVSPDSASRGLTLVTTATSRPPTSGRPPRGKRPRPFACGCGRKFSKREHLRRHDQLVHQVVRPYSCEVCMASFGTKQNMQVHFTTKKHQYRAMACRDAASMREDGSDVVTQTVREGGNVDVGMVLASM